MDRVFEMNDAADDQRFFIFERIPNLVAMTARILSEIRRIISMTRALIEMPAKFIAKRASLLDTDSNLVA